MITFPRPYVHSWQLHNTTSLSSAISLHYHFLTLIITCWEKYNNFWSNFNLLKMTSINRQFYLTSSSCISPYSSSDQYPYKIHFIYCTTHFFETVVRGKGHASHGLRLCIRSSVVLSTVPYCTIHSYFVRYFYLLSIAQSCRFINQYPLFIIFPNINWIRACTLYSCLSLITMRTLLISDFSDFSEF